MVWVTSATATTVLGDKSLAHSVDCWILNLEASSSIASLESTGFLFVTLLSPPPPNERSITDRNPMGSDNGSIVACYG